jgi:hypothetical protein
MNPDPYPGGPKTRGSGFGSGSRTLKACEPYGRYCVEMEHLYISSILHRMECTGKPQGKCSQNPQGRIEPSFPLSRSDRKKCRNSVTVLYNKKLEVKKIPKSLMKIMNKGLEMDSLMRSFIIVITIYYSLSCCCGILLHSPNLVLRN